jgi:hypothetical protein
MYHKCSRSIFTIALALGVSFQHSLSHEIPVHIQITQAACRSSAGLTGFVSQIVQPGNSPVFTLAGRTKSMIGWVQQGAEDEDSWNGFRFRNHFYEPLSSPARGLSDVATGQPSFQWAILPSNDHGWQDAREHHYEALTAASRDGREARAAEMFRDLGHVIHLIQDLSQPGHVRNDEHAIKKHIEGYGLDHLANETPLLTFPRGTLDWHRVGFTKRDRQLYTGGSPQPLNADAAARAGLGAETSRLGLAEFTNGNLLAEDALYRAVVKNTAKHGFPYPSLYGSTNAVQLLAGLPATARITLLPDKVLGKRLYLSKITDGIPIENHAVLTYAGLKSLQKRGQLNIGISIDDPLVLAGY